MGDPGNGELARGAGARARLRQFGDHLLNTPVERALRTIFNCLPERIQTRLRNERLRMRMSNGLKLVPEEELTRKYVASLQWLIDREGREAIGDYLEFGVFMGSSLSCFWRAVEELGLTHVRLFGFDSFQGLPDCAKIDDDGYWRPGNYAAHYDEARANLTRAGVDWSRVILVKGWFSDTLRPELVRQHAIRKASVVMVDCDLYSSAAEALAFCSPLFGESSVVLFDDWFSGGLAEKNLGEKRAFDEFLEANPHCSAEEFGSYGCNSKVFKLLARSMVARGHAGLEPTLPQTVA